MILQVSTKPAAHQKSKGSTAIKRSVSWNELHLNLGTPEQSFTNQDGSKAPKPHKGLLQRLQNAGSQVLEKAHVSRLL